MKKKIQRESGYSIIEIVTMILLMGLLAVGVSALFSWGFRIWRMSDEQAKAAAVYQGAYDKIIAEIREMQTSSNGSYPIESASSTELIFYTNIDGDDDRERIRLTLANGTIVKGIIQPVGTPATYPSNTEITEIIAQYVRNVSVFSYFDENFTGSQSAMNPIVINSIRLIKILLTIDINASQAPGPIDLTTYISVRNLKQNL